MNDFQLAQLNIARMLAPLDSETMSEFVNRLDEINAIADAAPGFVWRLVDENDNATSLRPFEDDWLIVNMSVWESVDALKEFTYNSRHSEVLRKRRQWFHAHTQAYFLMWWIPTGHTPTVQEAKEHLHYIQQHGDSEFAFTFKQIFPAPALEKF